MATDPNLAAGIAAVQAGDLSTAQQRLALVVRATPESVDAWWWLAQAMTDPARRVFCLERVLTLDPTHAEARQMLAPKPATPTPSARPLEPSPTELADLPR